RSLMLLRLLGFLELSGTHRDLHSFPTRRSSDLVLRSPRADCDLDDPRSVAEVDEHNASEVPTAVHPAAQPHPLPHVLQAQLATAVCPSGCGTDAVYGTSASHSTR